MQNNLNRHHSLQNRKRELTAVLFFALSFMMSLFLFPQLVSASESNLLSQQTLTKCQVAQIQEIYKPIYELKFDPSKPSTNNLVIWKAHEILAEKIWQLFESGELQKNKYNIADCLHPPLNDQDLMFATNNIFLQKTFERLQKINPKMYFELNQKIDFNQIVFQVFAFCEACQLQSKKLLGEKPAGYNLTTQSLFMNIQSLSPEDWDVIFIHELGHHFDQTRKDSKQYFNIDQVKVIIELQKKYDRGESIDDSEIKQIDDWIMSGLNIGLLAEWRVWSFTLKYLDGFKADYHFGKQTQWLKYYRKLSPSDRDIELFKMLDYRFKNSNDLLLSHELIQKRLDLIRLQIRTLVSNEQLKSVLLK